MNFCIVMGSPVKQNTHALCNHFMETLEKKEQGYSYICLAEKNINTCRECYACQQVVCKSFTAEEYGCRQKDDMVEIVEQILKADVLVLATPVFHWGPTAEMKTFMDRLFGMTKCMGEGSGSLWRNKKLALLLTHAFDAQFATGLYEESVKRMCKQYELEYAGMFSWREEETRDAFNSQECKEAAAKFAESLYTPGGIKIKTGQNYRMVDACEYRQAFTTLFNCYIHELSQYNPWLGTQITLDGSFLPEEVDGYFTLNWKQPVLLLDKEVDRPIGIAVFSYPKKKDSQEEFHSYVEEMFVIKSERHKKIAAQVAMDFWKTHPGYSGLCVLPENKASVAFWDKTISQAGYQFKKTAPKGKMVLYSFSIK